MIAALICIVLLAALAQFVHYCRSALASSREIELSDHVIDVAAVESDSLAPDDFTRFVQLVWLCPEHAPDRTQIRAVGAYYNLLRGVDRVCRGVLPSVSSWAELELQSCAHFAAVTLDRSISSSRDLFLEHASDTP